LDLSRVHKKLTEAAFFLNKMAEQERRIFGHGGLSEPFEPFDYYLSAFLNAGRTVDYRLCHEHKAIYKPWRKAWNARITPDENRLIKFMVDDRIAEVHASGSSRSEAREGVEFGIGTHHVDGGRIIISGPPGMPSTVVDKRIQFHDIRSRAQGNGSVCRLSSVAATDGGAVRGRSFPFLYCLLTRPVRDAIPWRTFQGLSPVEPSGHLGRSIGCSIPPRPIGE
jgi:hypothetical protein